MKPPTLGLIGGVWYGGVNLTRLVKNAGARMAGWCDLNSAHLNKSLALVAGLLRGVPPTFADYHDILAFSGRLGCDDHRSPALRV